MTKAYLAHSSLDKGYVDLVAKRLSRSGVIYDRKSFEPGVDSRDSIREGLGRSLLFVLFASSRSLSSGWVDFEVEEAEINRISAGRPASAMAIILDPEVGVGDLPPWISRTTVLRSPSAAHAARVIHTRLLDLLGVTHQELFVGRERLLEEFGQQVIARLEEEVPRAIIVDGLEGVGRRTFVTRALKDFLSLSMGPVISLKDTDGVDSLHLRLLEETSDGLTRTGLGDHIRAFGALSKEEKGCELARLLALIAKDNVGTIILCRGTLLDDRGEYIPEIEYLLRALREYPDVDVVLIHRRRPQIDGMAGDDLVRSLRFRVAPLDLESTELLVRQHLRLLAVPAGDDEVHELTLYMDGYPPTVKLAVAHAREYGLRTLLADKSILTDFKVRTFAPILDKMNLREDQWQVLRLLAAESPLPLDVLTSLTGVREEEAAKHVRQLIDLNLVLSVGNLFELAPPIVEAVFRAKGPITAQEYSQIATRLLQLYWEAPDEVPSLQILDATIHALGRAGSPALADFKDLQLPSSLFRIAKEAYDQEEWLTAIEFSKRTLDLDTQYHRARSVLCKAYVRVGRWSLAEKVLKELEDGGRTERFYLRGFLEWKRGNLPAAVSALRMALNSGDRSVSVLRDLAHCLFRLHHVAEAETLIDEALQRQPRNRYVLDLAIQIALASHSFEKAEKLLEDLRHVDERSNYLHRRAQLYAARKDFVSALRDVEEACQIPRPRREALAQKTDILIELGRFPEAQNALEVLQKRGAYGGPWRDVMIGLACKLQLRQGLWRQAESLWDQLAVKQLPVHGGLRVDILRQKVADRLTAPVERKQAQDELAIMGVVESPSIQVFETDTEASPGGDEPSA